MQETNNRLEVLLAQYSRNAISEPEFDELCTLIKAPDNDKVLKEMLMQEMNHVAFSALDKAELDRMLRNILPDMVTVKQQAKAEHNMPAIEEGAQEKRVSRITWRRIAVAASIILALSAAGYFILRNNAGKGSAMVSTGEIEAPKIIRAMITLANGQQVLLDSIRKGMLAMQDRMRIEKREDGQIVYQAAPGTASGDIQYNTLFNPRGSKVVNLTLEDGTKVWLNNESSLKYPVVFTGSERKVEITGEAYFEVAKDTTRRFIVEGNGAVTEVSGTHFNVNAYGDDGWIRVTLQEGSVKAGRQTSAIGSQQSAIGPDTSKEQQSVILQPGQQALIPALSSQSGKSTSIQVQTIPVPISVQATDIETVMAWKNGRFRFDNISLQELMRQISRWYDVEVVYESTPPDAEFNGELSRELKLSQLLFILGEISSVRCRMEEGKIMVE